MAGSTHVPAILWIALAGFILLAGCTSTTSENNNLNKTNVSIKPENTSFNALNSSVDTKVEVNTSVSNSSSQTASNHTQTVKIANWNLQVFGDTKESNQALMATYAEIIGQYDIIFVQEIRDADQSAFPKLCSLLSGYNCIVSSRAGRTQTKEQVGVIYHKGVFITSWKDFNPDAQDRWERPPIEITFDIEGYQLTAYNMHIDPDEVQKELYGLEQIVSSDGNVIVLGDLNADCSYYKPAVEKEFDSWNWIIKDTADTTVSGTDCAYDRIIMNDDAQEELIVSGVITSKINTTVSDHYLVWIEMKTNETTPKEKEEQIIVQMTNNSSTNTIQEPTDEKLNPTICGVVYDPPGKEPDDEMIQICNSGSKPVSIGSWIISDGEGSYTIPSGTLIQGGENWKVFGATYNPTAYKRGLYLANSGDCITLFDDQKNEIDSRCW